MHKIAKQKLSFWQQVGLILSLSTGLLLSKPVNAATTNSVTKTCQIKASELGDWDEASAVDFCKQLNLIRQKHNLPLLKISFALNTVARDHADDMYERGYFRHSNPQGQNAFDRMRAQNVAFQRAAENIAKGQKTNKAVLTAWMNSPGHRKNMLNASYHKFGIGMTNYNWVLNLTN